MVEREHFSIFVLIHYLSIDCLILHLHCGLSISIFQFHELIEKVINLFIIIRLFRSMLCSRIIRSVFSQFKSHQSKLNMQNNLIARTHSRSSFTDNSRSHLIVAYNHKDSDGPTTNGEKWKCQCIWVEITDAIFIFSQKYDSHSYRVRSLSWTHSAHKHIHTRSYVNNSANDKRWNANKNSLDRNQ